MQVTAKEKYREIKEIEKEKEKGINAHVQRPDCETHGAVRCEPSAACCLDSANRLTAHMYSFRC